jgi:cytochrome P450
MFQAIKDEDQSKESYVALKPLFREQAHGGLIRDQFLNLLLAGRDTSGSLLCWTFYSLSREPDLVRSLKAEIASILGPGSKRPPTKSELNKMAKLDQLITESTCRCVPLLSTEL